MKKLFLLSALLIHDVTLGMSTDGKKGDEKDDHQVFYLTRGQIATCPAVERVVQLLAIKHAKRAKMAQEGWTKIKIEEVNGSQKTEHLVSNSVINFEFKKVKLLYTVDKLIDQLSSKL